VRNPLPAPVPEAAEDLCDGQVHDIRWLARHMTPIMWLRAAVIALPAGTAVGAVVFALAVSW
jgi:hypothetical protein